MREPGNRSVVRVTCPGSLRRAVIGSTISEPTPDVDLDVSVVPFVRRAARRLAPGWTRSVRRFDETSVWGRGEFGGEDVHDGGVRIGTAEKHVHVRHHYIEHEQEMFPTGRYESRWYTVHGLPPRRSITVKTDREWRAGLLVRAGITLWVTAPAVLRAAILKDFHATFETGGQE